MTEWNRAIILEKYRQSAERGQPYTWFNYQPINLPGYEMTLSSCGRNCFDRSSALIQHLRNQFGEEPKHIIDWGCNLGFFCFELAKLGYRVTGIDHDRKNIDLCRYLARTNQFPVTPQFFCDDLSVETLTNYQGYDVALCFSVLHHLREKQIPTLKAFAETYPHAYIEMDGSGYGYNQLFSFYWQIDEIVETADRYGTGHRKRKTWHCSNCQGTTRYRNIKQSNLIGSRGVFCREEGAHRTVFKRELNVTKSHTWIDTNLLHEREMYQQFAGSRFFPSLISHGQNEEYRWIELEYVEDDHSFTEAELQQFYRYLEQNRLFMVDLTLDSFLFTRGRLKVIDLESVFEVKSTLSNLIREISNKQSLPFSSYREQLQYLTERLNK